MNVTPLRHFGKRFQEAIDGAGISQADLARHFKVTPQAIHGWKKSKYPPALTVDRWVSLATLLNVNLEWLALGIGPRERADMSDPMMLEMLRQFRQLDGAQRQVIMATIAALLLQKHDGGFEAGNRP